MTASTTAPVTPPSAPASTPVDLRALGPRIIVVGVGGAGNNAVNNMIRYNLQGVDYLALNTDAQHLHQSLVPEDRRIQLGLEATQGLGAGSHPEVGRAAAEESLDDVVRHLKGTNMVFITAGMGGGTGTGAAPVIAQAAREMGILTVGVVTRPFNFEGPHRARMADSGIAEMEQYVDTLIVIPNQNLFRVATDKTTFADAFKMADDVLYAGVRGVTDLMIMPGLVNLDFADIRAVMTEMGKAMMGTGEASGDDRALKAAEAAISNPLLDDVSMRGAKGVLINITGGMDMTLFEVDAAANRIREEIDVDSTIDTNIIFGSTFDEKLDGRMRVSVVATGIDSEAIKLRLAEKAGEAKRESAEAERAEMQLSMDKELNIAGHSVPHTYTDPADFSDEGSEHDTAGYEFDTVQAGRGAVHREVFDSATDDRAYHDRYAEDQGAKKKGFFSRFMSTLSGKGDDEGSSAPEHFQGTYQQTPTQQPGAFPQGWRPEAEEAMQPRATTTASQNPYPTDDYLSDDFDQADVQDIPAYLRRKTK